MKQLIYSGGVSYIDIYKVADKLNLGYKNLEILQEKNPNMKDKINTIKKKLNFLTAE